MILNRKIPLLTTTRIRIDDDGAELVLTGTGYAVRCAAAIAEENYPDARWALEVLNKYGHLVPHPADALSPEKRGEI